MKCSLLYGFVFSLLAVFFLLSCMKEYSCEGCSSSNTPSNKPPVAIAGTDQILTLPVNSTSLDGSRSADPDSNITTYQWAKVSGPSSFSLSNLSAALTQLTGLVQGMYLFELKVSDAGGLFSKDTVQIVVNAAVITAPPLDTIFTDLAWYHWHPPSVDSSNTMDDQILIQVQAPENSFLNVPDSNIQVFVRTEPSPDWIKAHKWILNNYDCVNYIYEYSSSTISIYACRLDLSLVGKKVAVRVVIK
jgi:hypothetical protein